MPRGGPRPGAGAPRGNLNALKTGAHSKQLRAAIGALLAVPQTRRAMLALLQQKQRDTRRFRDIIFNAAKLIHDTELSTSISRQLEQQIRKIQKKTKQLNSAGQSKPRASPPRAVAEAS